MKRYAHGLNSSVLLRSLDNLCSACLPLMIRLLGPWRPVSETVESMRAVGILPGVLKESEQFALFGERVSSTGGFISSRRPPCISRCTMSIHGYLIACEPNRLLRRY